MADLTDDDSTRRAVADAVERLGGLDALVGAAGGWTPSTAVDRAGHGRGRQGDEDLHDTPPFGQRAGPLDGRSTVGPATDATWLAADREPPQRPPSDESNEGTSCWGQAADRGPTIHAGGGRAARGPGE